MNQRFCAWVLSMLLWISVLLTACGGPSGPSDASAPPAPPADSPHSGASTAATGTYEDGSTPELRGDKLRLTLDDGQEVVIALYDNTAVDALLERLPMEDLAFFDLSGMEKPIRQLEEPLSMGEEEPGYAPITGEMVIYRPWGNFTIFYGDFRYSDELVPLGIVESGLEAMAEQAEDFGGTLELLEGEAPSGGETADPLVYMTTEITPEALTAIYEALDWTPTGNAAV